MSEAGEYAVVAARPSPEDYLRLRAIAGLSGFSLDAARIGLRQSWFAVVVRHGDAVVGMGRVIGDGGCFFQIVDIAVDPAHQKRGLGKRIMDALMTKLWADAPPGAYVSLIADRPADALYAQFGFKPTAPRSLGMAISLKPGAANV